MKKLLIILAALAVLAGCATMFPSHNSIELLNPPEEAKLENLLAPFVLEWGEPDLVMYMVYIDGSIAASFGWSGMICPDDGKVYFVTFVYTWGYWNLQEQHGELISESAGT